MCEDGVVDFGLDWLTSGSNPVIVGNLDRKDREYLSDIFPGVKDLALREKVPGTLMGLVLHSFYKLGRS